MVNYIDHPYVICSIFFFPDTNFYLSILTKLAHNLAKLSIKFLDCVVLMEDVLSSIK